MNREHILPQILLRSWPFPRGAGRLIDRYFSRTKFDQNIATVQTTDGFQISVEPNDLIGRHIYLTGEFDRSIVEVLCNFSNPGDILLDIGANIGYVSACFLQNVERSSVIAVEPQPGILNLLESNLARFGRSEIYPFALGNRNGMAFFEIDQYNKGASHVSATNAPMKVEMRTADRMFADLAIKKVDIVKLDVEGFEEQVLKSCRAEIETLRPRTIVFEGHLAESFRATELLSEIGYMSYGIKKHLTKLTLHPIRTSLDCIYHDYIAVSDWRLVPTKAKRAYGTSQSNLYGPLPPS